MGTDRFTLQMEGACTPQVDLFGLSEQGPVRDSNQDQFLIASMCKRVEVFLTNVKEQDVGPLVEPQGTLLVVADGMGGHSAGQEASAIAVQTFVKYMHRKMHWHLRIEEAHESAVLSEFQLAFFDCQAALRDYAALHPESDNLGTTLTAGYLAWPRLFVLHAGDSRCYLLRGQSLRQVTKDHTLTQQMIDQGTLSESAAQESPFAHLICNAIGGSEAEVRPELSQLTLEEGDTILLCSDGLSRYVSDEQLCEVLSKGRPARESCQELLELALAQESKDNVTLVVARITSSLALSTEKESAATTVMEVPLAVTSEDVTGSLIPITTALNEGVMA